MWKGCKLKLKKTGIPSGQLYFTHVIPVALNSKLPHAFLSHVDVDWLSESITCHSEKRNESKEPA